MVRTVQRTGRHGADVALGAHGDTTLVEQRTAADRYGGSSPFDTLESAHEYVTLLVQEVEGNGAGISEDISIAVQEGATRRLEALRLVQFKLRELIRHLSASRRILNDLRMLRRILEGERPAGGTHLPIASHRRPAARSIDA